jgi:hypothetical protein
MAANGSGRTKARLLVAAALLGIATAIPASMAAPGVSAAIVHANPPRFSSGAGPETGDPFTWKNWSDGQCLGIAGGAYEADAVQWKCNGSTNQMWAWGPCLISDGLCTGFYQLVNGNNSCLGSAGGNTGQGTAVVGWQCLGPTHPDQYWAWVIDEVVCEVESGETITYYGFLYNGNDVVGVASASTAEGAHLILWPYQYSCNNQAWTDGYSTANS